MSQPILTPFETRRDDEWTLDDQQRFRTLARLEALSTISQEESKELELLSNRRRELTQRIGEKERVQVEEKLKATERLLDALEDYARLFKR